MTRQLHRLPPGWALEDSVARRTRHCRDPNVGFPTAGCLDGRRRGRRGASRRRDYQFVNIADKRGPSRHRRPVPMESARRQQRGNRRLRCAVGRGGAALFTGSGGPLTSRPPVPAASLHSTGRSRLTTTAHSPSEPGSTYTRPQRSVFTVAPAGTLTTIASGYLVPSGSPFRRSATRLSGPAWALTATTPSHS